MREEGIKSLTSGIPEASAAISILKWPMVLARVLLMVAYKEAN